MSEHQYTNGRFKHIKLRYNFTTAEFFCHETRQNIDAPSKLITLSKNRIPDSPFQQKNHMAMTHVKKELQAEFISKN